MIKAGQMRETITLEMPSGKGPLGQTVWSVFETARAAIEVGKGIRGGHELNRPDMGGSQVWYTFTIRFIPGVRANMRIVLSGSGRIFHITDVRLQTEGNARTWDLYAREVFSV